MASTLNDSGRDDGASAEERPVLSVVIPVRNRPDAIRTAVESVLAHAGSEVEVVVVDDGSTDGTAAAVSAIEDARVRLVTIEASGVSTARNIGVAEARADFVAFLDSDDVVLPGWVDEMVRAARAGLDIYSCANTERHDRLGDSTIAPTPLGPTFGDLVGRYQPGAFGLSKRAFGAAGGYVAGLRHGENTVLWMALGRVHCSRPFEVGHTSVALAVVHRRDRPYDALRYYESAMTTLAVVGDMLSRDRGFHASHLGIAGVAAGRLGRRREALQLLARAIALRPLSAVGYVRWLRALVWR